MSLVLSPINLPLIKSDCDLDNNVSSTVFNRLPIAKEAILYGTERREIDLQFFKYCLGLSPFGMQLIIQVLKDGKYSPFYMHNLVNTELLL